MKEALRTDGNTAAWRAWSATQNQLRQLRQPAPPLVFPGEQEIFRAMYAQVGKEEQVISPPYTRIQLDASMRGRKKRKQGEDNALIGSHHAACAVWHVHWWRSATSGSSLHLGVTGIWSPCLMAY